MTLRDKATDILRERGMVRLRDFRDENDAQIPTVILSRLLRDGVVESPSKGIYRLAGTGDFYDSDAESIAIVLVRTDGVLCLESAAYWHNLTEVDPSCRWVAMPLGSAPTRNPSRHDIPIRLMLWSESMLTMGVELVDVSGVKVKMTNKERTVIDLFRHHKITRGGLDQAREALRGLLAEGGSERLIAEYAEKCRVTALVMPFLGVHHAQARM